MIYRFKITSSEIEDFVREIEIGDEQTFLELHNAIQESLGYDNSQMASFYQIDTEGERGIEVALFEMNTEDDDNMNVVAMDVAMIREFVTKENPEMIYVFDFFSNRYFNMKLVKKGIAKANENYPKICLTQGEAPVQIIMDAENFDDVDFEKMNLNSDLDFQPEDYFDDFNDQYDEGPEFENLDDYEDQL